MPHNPSSQYGMISHLSPSCHAQMVLVVLLSISALHRLSVVLLTFLSSKPNRYPMGSIKLVSGRFRRLKQKCGLKLLVGASSSRSLRRCFTSNLSNIGIISSSRSLISNSVNSSKPSSVFWNSSRNSSNNTTCNTSSTMASSSSYTNAPLLLVCFLNRNLLGSIYINNSSC